MLMCLYLKAFKVSRPTPSGTETPASVGLLPSSGRIGPPALATSRRESSTIRSAASTRIFAWKKAYERGRTWQGGGPILGSTRFSQTACFRIHLSFGFPLTGSGGDFLLG